MKDDNLKWYFPTSINIAGRGENDPQRELFPGDARQTLVRESIQNSLDHHNPQAGGPVRVEYRIRKFLTSEFGCLRELREHIQSCFNISQADRFRGMLEALDSPEMYVLDVSDYNTIGMDYDYESDTGRFKKFVRYTGDPNSVAGSGGSHGYGKITYFSLSEINSIIVSSMTPDGTCTFEGVSRLATHPTGAPRSSFLDTGFLDKGDGAPIQEKKDDYIIIPNVFRRQKPGSTVSIPFFNVNNITSRFRTFCEAVLRNFFAAINDGMLEVLVDFGEGLQFECNQKNIEDIFSNRFFNDPPYDRVRRSFIDKFNPHPYWLAYRNRDIEITDANEENAIDLCAGHKYICFHKLLPILGKVSLFLNIDTQHGNDLVLFMRCPRMVVAEHHSSSASRGYSAVFLCDDEDKGNKLLRNMEDAAHKTWSKRQLRFDKRPQEMIDQAEQIENEMREFINWSLDIVFPKNQTESDDVELEDFTVPMISESDTTNPLIGDLINIQGNDDEALGAPVDIHPGELTSQKKSAHMGAAQIIEPKKVKKTDTPTDISGGRKRKHPVIPVPKPRPKPNGDENHTEDSEGEEKTVRVKFPVKYRIFSEQLDNGQVLYTLIIHSEQQEEKAYLTLIPVGETDDKSCNVYLAAASKGKIRENEITGVPLEEGKNIITFSVDTPGEYAFTLLAEHEITIKE